MSLRFSRLLRAGWLCLATAAGNTQATEDSAADVAAAADAFPACVSTLLHTAREQGISAEVVDNVLSQVQFVPRVIELDRRQPEFTATFADYLGRRVTPFRIEQGRKLLAQHRPLLQRLTKQYGIPAQYLVAFWGLETNYGRYIGKMDTLNSLATLACDPRRSGYFTGELIHALKLIDEDNIRPEQLLGSWAGALGQTQFMPSAFRRYAVDGDGDGRKDLWQSSTDALTSAANFLQQLGWQREERWGREVLLPANFDYRQAGLNQPRPLQAWAKLGITTAFGGPLPDAELDAALVIPSGHRGPAFLVYQNFHVIMGWNRSEFYALAVGHLADRINGSPPLKQAPPHDIPKLSVALVKQLQENLNQKGLDAGKADGILGPQTRTAIRQYQQQQGLIADGYPDIPVLRSLGLMAP